LADALENAALSLRATRLGDWLVEPSLNRLSRADETIQLELKKMDVLVCLIERAGEMVPRNEIVDRVWATEFIADNTLTRAIKEIRYALGDDAKNPSYIETIHRRGYRLIAPVRPAPVDHRMEERIEPFPGLEIREVRAEDRTPYPGLASFTEDDAEFFFGRETEVAQMWRKLTARRLLAVIGPSGVGKSSFLRAGVIPARPAGWSVVVCQPGEAPFASLAQALVPEFAGDLEATAKLVGVGNGDRAFGLVSRWRHGHDQALLIVDQFEELFTLCSPEAQVAFTSVLRRFVDEADVHVLLAMRDDFLYRCHAQISLRPLFADLTVLEQPDGESLQRALFEPAKRLGYSFEDDHLVEEMVAEVEGERGALPLLAFAVARLWEKRDSSKRLLTRQAYDAIGHVGGALARHAEATLVAVGAENVPFARELFRNLLTSEGTRAVRESGELLSVFSDSQRENAETVLSTLIDARLLTTFEVDSTETDGNRRVELVHESLLISWPRLVRWQTQDASASQLRDQLRQAARTWEERDRADDYLWTGRAYREFAVWRESYPGGLTEIEEEFSRAMMNLAARRVRRRRLGLAAGISILLAVLVVVTTLWGRSEHAAHRAEAQHLVALGQLELEDSPTTALAWGRASLERADTEQGRLLVAKALSRGPIPRILALDSESEGVAISARMSSNGEWTALSGIERLKVVHRSGGPVAFIDNFRTQGMSAIWTIFDPDEDRLVAWKQNIEGTSKEIRAYGLPDFSMLASADFSPQETWKWCRATQKGFFILSRAGGEIGIRKITFDGEDEVIGRFGQFDEVFFDPAGEWFVTLRGREVFRYSLEEAGFGAQRILRLDRDIHRFRIDAGQEWLAAIGDSGRRVYVWALNKPVSTPYRSFATGGMANLRVSLEDGGKWIAVSGELDGAATILVWDLLAPRDSAPITMRNESFEPVTEATFGPNGRWLVTSHASVAAFWSLDSTRDLVFEGDGRSAKVVGFSADEKTVVTFGRDFVRLRPLVEGGDERELPVGFPGWWGNVRMDPEGEFLLGTQGTSPVLVAPLDGSRPFELEAFEALGYLATVAYDPERGLVATAPANGTPEQKVIQVGSFDSDAVQILGPADDAGEGRVGRYEDLAFLPDGRILSCGLGGLRRWNLEDGSSEVLYSGGCGFIDVAANGRVALVLPVSNRIPQVPMALELATGGIRPLDQISGEVSAVALSPTGDVFAAAIDNHSILIGGLSGGEPHIFLGHEASVTGLAFSADGRRLASSDRVGEIRVWSVPDISMQPFHTLPLTKLKRELDTITNLRVIRDASSSNGWRTEIGPFPGWETVPNW